MAFATINSRAMANSASAAPAPTPAAAPPPTPVDHNPTIDHAFASEPLLRKRVYAAIHATPQHAALFEDIARYTSTLLIREAQQQNTATTTLPVQVINDNDGGDGPAAKKRKLAQNGGTTTTTPNGGVSSSSLLSRNTLMGDAPLQFYVQDLSFAVPQRKKLTLEITAGPRGWLRARNQTSKEVEFGVALDRIQHILCLPVPEKTQRQFNFCVIPQYADGINPPPDTGEATPPPESIVWTVPDGPPKAAFSGTGEQLLGADTAEALIRRVLNENLNLASNKTNVVRPDEKEFVSAMPEAHRKTEQAYHVKAFRGSKEGYLFLLSTGIFFGFKKPLLFFAYENIDSISYTSVLQRTFNLNVTARPTTTTTTTSHGDGDSDETIEFEFSMIDQADYAGIDAYVKRHGLQDASLAEARRARRYNVNGTMKAEGGNGDASVATGQDGGGAAAGDGAEAEESELQKAQRELEDREDEEEEDYDPGSDGDSDGSGSSSEEDEEDGYGGEAGNDDDDGKDLVAEELCSEAEEVPEEEEDL